MDPSEGTLIRVNADRLDFRIDNFNLVIRLSIAQQLAISIMSILCAVPLILPSLVNLWNLKLYSTEAAPNSQKLFSSLQLKPLEWTMNMTHGTLSRQAHVFRCGFSFS